MMKSNEKYLATQQVASELYDFLNEKFFESALSKPVITLQPDESEKCLGWFVPNRIWKDGTGNREVEINLCSNFLDKPLIEVAETLLHELCHQFAYENFIKDTSRNGTYHNKEFINIALSHGLNVSKRGKNGAIVTTLSKEALKIIKTFNPKSDLLFRRITEADYLDMALWELQADLLKKGQFINISDDGELLSEELQRQLYEKLAKITKTLTKDRKNNSTRKYECPCCKQSVRATKQVNILCGDCNIRMIETHRKTVNQKSNTNGGQDDK